MRIPLGIDTNLVFFRHIESKIQQLSPIATNIFFYKQLKTDTAHPSIYFIGFIFRATRWQQSPNKILGTRDIRWGMASVSILNSKYVAK